MQRPTIEGQSLRGGVQGRFASIEDRDLRSICAERARFSSPCQKYTRLSDVTGVESSLSIRQDFLSLTNVRVQFEGRLCFAKNAAGNRAGSQLDRSTYGAIVCFRLEGFSSKSLRVTSYQQITLYKLLQGHSARNREYLFPVSGGQDQRRQPVIAIRRDAVCPSLEESFSN